MKTLSRELSKTWSEDFIQTKFKALTQLISNVVSKEDNVDLLDGFDFSIRFFEFVDSITKELLPKIVERFKNGHEEFHHEIGFLRDIIDKFIEDIVGEGYHALPNQLPISDIDRLLDTLSVELTKGKKRYNVFFEITDLNLDGKKVTAQNAVLYDSRNWHLGESHQWDLKSSLSKNEPTNKHPYREYSYGNFKTLGSNEIKRFPFRRTSARAVVNLEAFDVTSAALEARTSLRRLLAVLVFEFSDERHLKYHPKLTNAYQVLSEDLTEGNYQVQFQHSEVLTMPTKKEHVFDLYDEPRITTFYGDRIYKALSWFNAGFWEEEEYSKYVSYWIGLEQLLELQKIRKGKKNNPLLELVPRIAITWRDYPHTRYVISQHLREIGLGILNDSAITNLLSRYEELNGWKNKDYILLDNLPLIKKILHGNTLEQSIINLEEWIKENRDYIERYVNFLRKEMKFRIAYLYARRNSIMHEGKTDSVDMSYFVLELKQILGKIISILVLFPAEKKSPELYRLINIPFSTQ